jgi:uroporphyrin-III C-methyltransferase / precorrin-2 dehydrogenase / sirohydrochlorin ferrochelatase
VPPFPLWLSLTDRRVVVVGAGAIGSRRTLALVRAGADVLVVAPEASIQVQDLAAANSVTWERRAFAIGDVEGAWLVHTATGDGEVDATVNAACEARQIWCVNAGAPEVGSAATATQVPGPDGVILAIYGGADPGRAIALRDFLTTALAHAPLRRTRSEPGRMGRVTLLGGGPGDPSLVTVRGRQAIAAADVLVVDRLAPAALWADPAPGVEVIDVGKAPGRHAASQTEINSVLVSHALAGKSVVRIKGGDSFVLGRGGEEALACVNAGVPVEIIPGVTSAISVPAAAGIPVTHRNITSSFVIASAHEGPAGVVAATVGAPAQATLVLLMGAGQLAGISQALIDSGQRPGRTPLAIIESGWTPRQRTEVSTVAGAARGEVSVHPPAVVVIGEVVSLRHQLGDLGAAAADAGHN